MSVQWLDRETLDEAIGDHIQHTDVVLDVGCGLRPQTFFQPRLHICCEPHSEYVRILQDYFAGCSDVVILQGTGQEIARVMPDDSVDTVFLIDLIEHLEKDEGRRLLTECQRIARRQIILFTPLGFMHQEYEHGDIDGWGLRGSYWQVHRSGWTPDDFDSSWDILGCQAYHTISGKGEPLDHPFGAFWAIKNIPHREPIASPIKVAVLSHVFPPSPSGQAMVLYRLLRDLKPNSYALLSRESYATYTYLQRSSSKCVPDSSPRLPARYYHLPPEFRFRRPNRLGTRPIRELVNILLGVFLRARNIIRIIRQEKCEAIVACSGDLCDLPAGYLASRWTRMPFYAYVFDYYSYQWSRRLHRSFSRYVEPIVLKGATCVIVANEFLRDEYRRRYQVEPTVIHNPLEVREADRELPWPATQSEIRIVYTGAIYHANYDALHNLIAAIHLLRRSDVKLHLYTAQSPAELRQARICGPIVHHDHLASSLVFEVQRQADILFLPLAFNSTLAEVVRTSAPGKMGEYLASGRPILVHAPADSFVSSYFREHQCGIVVDQNEPAMLARAIHRILDEEELRRGLTENARARARADFDLAVARARFLEVFEPKARR